MSGLPPHALKESSHPYYRDVHMDTAKGLTGAFSNFDVRMGTAKGLTLSDDIRMETARGGTTMKQGGLQMSQRELLESAEVKRKATVAQLCKYQLDSHTHLFLLIYGVLQIFLIITFRP